MDAKPWLPYLATDFIKSLRPRTVFEWGSGNSTLFFAQMNLDHFVSIEHHPSWYIQVGSNLESLGYWSEDYKLIPFEPGEIGPDKSNPEHYKSGSTELGPVNFKRYAGIIDDYGLFDLILVDGMARTSCIRHAFSHVASGGCLAVDNTNDRPYYLEQNLELFGNWEKGWERVDILGHGPILDYKWQTTFFINRTKNDYQPGA